MTADLSRTHLREGPPRSGPSIATMVEGSVLRYLGRHPLAVDVALAVAVAGVAIAAADPGSAARLHGADWWDLALAAPLVVRRRHPRAAALLIGAVCLAQWGADVRAMSDVAVLMVLYSLGAYDRHPSSLLIAAVAEVGVVMAFLRWAPSANQALGIATATGTVAASWIAGMYVRTRRAYVQSIRDRAETAERERDSQALVAVAAERARLAREMHDVIAHSLAVMITLNDAAAAQPLPPQGHDSVVQAADVGRQALDDMHRMLAVLRNGDDVEYAPQPGLGQLQDLASTIRTAGLEVALSITGDMDHITPSAELAAFRIVQEGLTNVLKHGRQVTRTTVDVARSATGLAVQIRDDGAPRPGGRRRLGGESSPGHGLSGMRERARLFAGDVTAGPHPDGGWEVCAWLVLEQPGGLR